MNRHADALAGTMRGAAASADRLTTPRIATDTSSGRPAERVITIVHRGEIEPGRPDAADRL